MLKKLFFLSLVAFLVFVLVYTTDRVMFVNFGSIRPVKDASKTFKNLEELTASCKAEDKSLVLVVHSYSNGTSQARCEDQFFAQTWDVSKFIP